MAEHIRIEEGAYAFDFLASDWDAMKWDTTGRMPAGGRPVDLLGRLRKPRRLHFMEETDYRRRHRRPVALGFGGAWRRLGPETAKKVLDTEAEAARFVAWASPRVVRSRAVVLWLTLEPRPREPLGKVTRRLDVLRKEIVRALGHRGRHFDVKVLDPRTEHHLPGLTISQIGRARS